MITAAIIHSPPAYEFGAMVTTARAWLRHYGATWYVCALAPGWDTAFAHAAILEGVPVAAAMPFIRPVSQWDSNDRNRHNQVVARAKQAFVMSYAFENDADRKRCDDWRAQSAGVIFYDAGEVIESQPLAGKIYVNLGPA